jgi:hypothetical protein
MPGGPAGPGIVLAGPTGPGTVLFAPAGPGGPCGPGRPCVPVLLSLISFLSSLPNLLCLQNSTEPTKNPSNGPVLHSYFLSSLDRNYNYRHNSCPIR